MPEETVPETADNDVLGDKSLFVDRRLLMKALAELNDAIGFVPVDGISVQELRQQMIDAGVRPEDNEGTREMIALRYPEDQN